MNEFADDTSRTIARRLFWILVMLSYLLLVNRVPAYLLRLEPCDAAHIGHQTVIGGHVAECSVINKSEPHPQFVEVWR